MDKSRLMILMRNPELMGDRDLPEVKELVEEYPFFQSARMLYVKNLRNQGYSNYGKVLRETAVFVNNRTKLFFLLDERVIIKHDADPSQIAVEEEIFDFAKLARMTDFTVSQPSKKTPKLVADYFGDLSNKIDMDDFRQAFGKKNKTAVEPQSNRGDHTLHEFKRMRLSPGEPPVDGIDLSEKSSVVDSGLMETLADTFFKTGNYKQALSMYEKLCLTIPEKNSYFAAQIEKIKEIINNK